MSQTQKHLEVWVLKEQKQYRQYRQNESGLLPEAELSLPRLKQESHQCRMILFHHRFVRIPVLALLAAHAHLAQVMWV